MLKRLPKAHIEFEEDYYRGQRWVDRQTDALTEEEGAQLKLDAQEQAQQSLKGAVYEAVQATAGEPGVVLLERHASRIDELAMDPEADGLMDYDRRTLASAWVEVLEQQLWDATSGSAWRDDLLRPNPSLPAHNSLVRLIFPDVDEDYAKVAKEDTELSGRVQLDAFLKKYDFERFIVAHSSLREQFGPEGLTEFQHLVDVGWYVESVWTARWEESPLSDEDFPAYITFQITESREMDVLVSRQELEAEGPPLILNALHGETFWFYQDSIYVTEEDLEPDDVLALINEKENKKRSKLNKARDLQAMRDEDDGGKPAKAGKAGKKTRKSIPEEVRHAVWRRDEGKCVDCDSQQELEFDHVIPLAMGGSNTERNLQLLCADCNRRKGATLG